MPCTSEQRRKKTKESKVMVRIGRDHGDCDTNLCRIRAKKEHSERERERVKLDACEQQSAWVGPKDDRGGCDAGEAHTMVE